MSQSNGQEKNLGGRPKNPNTPPRKTGGRKIRIPSVSPPSEKQLAKILEDIRGKARKFLVAYAYTGCITTASDMAGCHFKSHYGWLRSSEKYAKAFREVQQESKQRLLAEAWRRAYQGSDRILMILLQRYFPKFRECKNYSVNAHVKHAGEIEVKHSADELSVDELPLEMRKKMLEMIRAKKSNSLETNGHLCPPSTPKPN